MSFVRRAEPTAGAERLAPRTLSTSLWDFGIVMIRTSLEVERRLLCKVAGELPCVGWAAPKRAAGVAGAFRSRQGMDQVSGLWTRQNPACDG